MPRLIKDKYEEYKASCNEMFYKLKANEEELNRIFIDIYGLQDELTPDVDEKDVTVHFVADTKEEAPEGLRSSNYLLTKKRRYQAVCFIFRWLYARKILS